MPKPQFPKPKWEVDPRTHCPCGSGLQSRKCCRPNQAIIEKGHEFFRNGDFAIAERAWRAEITRYIGWVFQHTLPLLRHPAGPPAELVRVDVGALEGLAERIAWALDKQGKQEAIVYTFDHLATTIALPGLRERMAYLKCLWLLHRLGQPAKQERELCRFNFSFGKTWQKKLYAIKQVVPVIKEEANEIVVITVYTFYF